MPIFLFLTTLMPVESSISNTVNPALGFDIMPVSLMLDAGISKKTPVSKAALNIFDAMSDVA